MIPGMIVELCPNVCKEGNYCKQIGDTRFYWVGEIKGEPMKSDVSIGDCLQEKRIATYGEIMFPQDFTSNDHAVKS
jgi:hypothetical protein